MRLLMVFLLVSSVSLVADPPAQAHVQAEARVAPALAPNFVPIHPIVKDVDGHPCERLGAFSRGAPMKLADGRLMMVFGTDTEKFSNSESLWVAFSRDGGRTWLSAREIERNPQAGLKHGRPAVVQASDGAIWIFYYGWVKYDGTVAGSRSDIWAVVSTDGGRTFGARRKIWEGYTGMLQGAIRTAAGNLLLPLSHLVQPQEFAAGCLVSKDEGQTWQHSSLVSLGTADRELRAKTKLNGGALEPSVVELEDGRILMTIRTIIGKLFESYSADGGFTWSPAVESSLSCGGTQFVTRLASGRIVLVWNPANEEKTAANKWPNGYDVAAISVSNDQGASWSRPLAFARAKRGQRVIHSLLIEVEPGNLLLTLPEDNLLLSVRETDLPVR